MHELFCRRVGATGVRSSTCGMAGSSKTARGSCHEERGQNMPMICPSMRFPVGPTYPQGLMVSVTFQSALTFSRIRTPSAGMVFEPWSSFMVNVPFVAIFRNFLGSSFT